ncbi:MAG TPA: hypothetical protein VG245_06575 [Candidatus Dormibacteraeota bacterium]|jgi:hypothetical protein|nr:hypothetical protein [Candidatus Dormibacteraeota bacterium]
MPATATAELLPVPPAQMTAVARCPACDSFGRPIGVADSDLWFGCTRCGARFAAHAAPAL